LFTLTRIKREYIRGLIEMSAHYYDILGLPASASLAEIKQSYRRKAKQLHPDRNPSPLAHEQFLALSEAYDFLFHLKSTGKRTFHRQTRSTTSVNRKEQEAKRRAESRARAQKNAHMRFEAYKKTEHYKNSVAVEVITQFVSLLLSMFVLIVSPVLFYVNMGVSGVVLSIVLVLSTFPIWIDVFKRPRTYFDLSNLQEALGRLIHFDGFQSMSSLAVNGTLFCLIGLSTLIPLWVQLVTLLIASAAGFLFAYLSKRMQYLWFFGLGLGPFIVLFTLLTNYVGSHSPIKEEYSYKQELSRNPDGSSERNTCITLEGGIYNECKGIRFFMEQREVKAHRKVRYTIEEGLLGWRVMTDYEFK